MEQMLVIRCGRISRDSEPVSQFEISIKRNPNKALYRKIRIQFRKISNYGIASSFRVAMIGRGLEGEVNE